MNCFQKSYLWLLNTTLCDTGSSHCWLWIAFKNLIFDYWTQLNSMSPMMKFGCELLSKILSLTIEHNVEPTQTTQSIVVNCFQKSYLWLLNTTVEIIENFILVLWIAFKNLIFDYWTQLVVVAESFGLCCELLSKILSLTIEHNSVHLVQPFCGVVNCFQKSYLWLLNTTDSS